MTKSKGKSFAYLLRDTSRLLLRTLQERITPSGITLSQNFILRELWETDGLTVRELAVRLRIVDPRMTTTIDALEKKSLVKRVGSKEDRRKVHVYLTAKGKALMAELEQHAIEVNEAALRGVSATDIDHVRDVLDQVKENLDSGLSG